MITTDDLRKLIEVCDREEGAADQDPYGAGSVACAQTLREEIVRLIEAPASHGTCSTCKHKGEMLTFPAKPLDPAKAVETCQTRFHVCDLMKLNEGALGEGFINEHEAREAEAVTPAFVVDGSGYFAQFIVREDFGCNRWEAAA